MSNYELLYIVSNQYTEAELGPIRDKVNALIGKYGGQLGFQEVLGKKKLAYPIKQVNHGYYLVTEFELAAGDMIGKLTNDLKLDKEILRAQIITKPKITPEEIARQHRQRAKAEEEVRPRAEGRPATKKVVAPKVDQKQLEEKLEEILQEDPII